MKETTSNSATLTWSPPGSDGGAVITGYIIEKKEQYSTRWSRVNRYSVTETEMAVPDLKEGLEYEFRVYAENKAGVGKASEPTRPTVIRPPFGEFLSPSCGAHLIFQLFLFCCRNYISIVLCLIPYKLSLFHYIFPRAFLFVCLIQCT